MRGKKELRRRFLILLHDTSADITDICSSVFFSPNDTLQMSFVDHNQGVIRQQCGLSCCSWGSDGLWCALTGDHCGQTSSHRRDTGTASLQSGTADDGTAHLSGKTCNTCAHTQHTEFRHVGKEVVLQTTTNMIYPTLIGLWLSPKQHLPPICQSLA